MRNLVLIFFLYASCLLAQLPTNFDSLQKTIFRLPDDTLKANKLISLAKQVSTYDTVIAGTSFRKAFSIALKVKENKTLGNCYSYYGRFNYQLQQFTKAREFFLKAIDCYTKVGFDLGIAKSYNNLGVLKNDASEFDSAIYFFNASLKIQQKLNNTEGIANCYQNTGNSLNLKGDYEAAMKSFLEAMKLYEKINFWDGLATVYYNLGYVHFNLKQPDKAMEFILKSLEVKKTKTFDKVGISYCSLFLARIHSDEGPLKNNAKAKQYYQDVVSLSAETGDRIGQISSLQGLGKIYYEEGRLDSLLSCSLRALKVSEEVQQDRYIAASLSQLGETYYLLKQYLFSIEYYVKALNLAKQINDYSDALQAANGLAKVYQATGKYKEAFDYLNVAVSIKDSIFKEATIKSVSDMEAKYENQKKLLEIDNLNKDKQIKQQELEAKEKDLSQKNKSLFLILGSLIVVLVFAFYAYRNFKLAKKANVIISSQKEEVEIQKDLIATQKHLVEEKQMEIIASITYAKKIQHAVLTGTEVWNKVAKNYFIIYQPKDIVSGDFYWAYNTPNSRSIWLVADCTGHGVPGGFMSMLGNSFLNEIVVEKRIYKPDEILNRLRDKIIAALEQKGETAQQDGMDISLVVWNKVDNTLEFSGANNDGILLRNGQVLELKADKMPIGKYTETLTAFSSKKIEVHPGDTVYLSSDGFYDQFGGEKGKKFKYKNFLSLLSEVSSSALSDQDTRLRQEFNSWKGQIDQLDDVCVVGVKLS